MENNDNDSGWVCLTPLCDENGRALTLMERIKHATKVVSEHNLRAYEEAIEAIEASEMNEAQQRSAIRSVYEILTAKTEETVMSIANQLLMDHGRNCGSTLH